MLLWEGCVRLRNQSSILADDDEEEEEIYRTEDCEFAAKKRKKDHFRNKSKSQCFYREKWIYVHKESTRERHGYCTLGEAFNRLDFSSAIQDIRRFNYVVKLRNFSYVNNVAEVDVLRWTDRGVFTAVSRLLPLPGQLSLRLSQRWSTGVDGRVLRGRFIASRLDAINRSPLYRLLPADPAGSEDILYFNSNNDSFSPSQFCRHLILSEKGHIDWKLMYFALQKCYPIKEQYGDTLHFCRHCSILFWKDADQVLPQFL
ncbi:F-box only protein 25 [Chelonia mydas]|uniref:F-box only protein 25 n=1 Tax=Chelonia mydas TaxID=8469 RepID=M7C2Z5_CHEMY|nr:F-box only protein 25 [Chelonia mydas]